MQITGKCPTAVVDKTDGFQLYISKASADLEFFSAKSSEINLLVEQSSGDFTEFPVPEQFKTVIGGDKLVTSAVEHKE
jgi:adenylyl cyclase-associated protein